MRIFSFSRTDTKDQPLIERYTGVFSDLDGVVYRGGRAIDGTADAIVQLKQMGKQIFYITNNASRAGEEVAAHLARMSVQAREDQVVTSSRAAVEVLLEILAPPARVLVIGSKGLERELEDAGYVTVRSASDAPEAVVQGFTPDLRWADLAEACYALQERPGQEPLPWVATNTDWTIPLEQGLAPGNGTMVSAVHTAVQRLPRFAGKPERAIFDTALSRAQISAQQALVIGDRLDTDIQGAQSASIDAACVLTGSDRPKQMLAAPKGARPKYILARFADILHPYPAVAKRSDGSFRVEDARVRMDGHIVNVVREGNDPLNLLRAACAAIWDSGLAIYGLKVPEILTEDHWN